jgi:Zn-dependent protease with chaperone function
MITENDFVHPDDSAALRNMEAIPGFAVAMKTLLKYYHERLLHGMSLANSIRLSEKQLPDIYHRILPICKRLSINVPEFYLEMNPSPNAYTVGDTCTMVTITSGLLEYLDEDEFSSVLAHECGHIACHHMLYHTLALTLAQDLKGLLGDLIVPVALALMYWSRKSELSADRAAAIAVGDANEVVWTQIRLAGGPRSITEGVNLEEFIKQADEYDALRDKTWDKLLQYKSVMNCDHPFAAVRVREILNWSKTEHYQRLLKNISLEEAGLLCPSCHQETEADWAFCKHCGFKLK